MVGLSLNPTFELLNKCLRVQRERRDSSSPKLFVPFFRINKSKYVPHQLLREKLF